MKNLVAIAYASAWIATAIAIIFAIKYTGSPWCLCALLAPACIQAEIENTDSNNEE